MRSEALEVARAHAEPGERLNVLREYLQAQILRSLHESEAFTCLSFVGGTALRFVFGIRRFSEDLDFSVEEPERYTPRPWLARLDRSLRLAGYDATVSWNDRKTVNTAWVRFGGLLHDLDLAAQPLQKLAVKLEIDTRPPAGAVTERVVIRRHTMVALQHHDLPSLMAGKLHAIVTRPRTKGRDWYDLLWYLSRVPPVSPNRALLGNALAQTGTADPHTAWDRLLRDAIDAADLAAARRDVAPFLEHPDEAAWITTEHLRSLLDRATPAG